MKKIAKIKWGSKRIVFVIPCLGIVIKIPRIYFEQACRVRKSLVSSDEKRTEKMFQLLFGGFLKNQQEMARWKETEHRLILRTYCSFLWGTVNIQKIGYSLPVDTALSRAINKKIREDLAQMPISGLCTDKKGNIKFWNYGGEWTVYELSPLPREVYQLVLRITSITKTKTA